MAVTQVGEARAEGEALRRLVKLKTRELKNVRRLAQVMHHNLHMPFVVRRFLGLRLCSGWGR